MGAAKLAPSAQKLILFYLSSLLKVSRSRHLRVLKATRDSLSTADSLDFTRRHLTAHAFSKPIADSSQKVCSNLGLTPWIESQSIDSRHCSMPKINCDVRDQNTDWSKARVAKTTSSRTWLIDLVGPSHGTFPEY